MKRLIWIIFIVTAMNCGKKDNKAGKQSHPGQDIGEKIACGNKIKEADVHFDPKDSIYVFSFEIHDDSTLLPLMKKWTDETQKEVTHQFWGNFNKASGKWVMDLEGYKLHYWSVSHEGTDSAFGFGNYCISMYGFEKGDVWICDFWEMEDFPWLKGKGLHVDNNTFKNTDIAMESVLPKKGLCVYRNIRDVLPQYLK